MRMIDNRAKFECECRLFEHMGMACCHMLKVMDVLGFTEILQQLIVNRWTSDARDVPPPHLWVYQRDQAGNWTMTHRHCAVYVHPMELVRLGDASVKACEKGMQILKEGSALYHILAEFDEQ